MKKEFLFLVLALAFTACSKDKVSLINTSNCTETISFVNEIKPIVDQYCISCHNVGNSTGYTLTNYSNISASIDKIIETTQANGSSLMPQGGPALADSLIQKIVCWKFQGLADN